MLISLEDYRIEQIEKPVPGAGEVLVKVSFLIQFLIINFNFQYFNIFKLVFK